MKVAAVVSTKGGLTRSFRRPVDSPVSPNGPQAATAPGKNFLQSTLEISPPKPT